MLKNTLINRIATKKIAHALGDLNERVVFVGGAVVSLYIDDPAADDVRPTKDIDISLQIASLGDLEKLRQSLISKGFSQSIQDNVICRFRYQDIKVDVMATKAIGWAPANEWFEYGFNFLITKQIDELTIRLLPLPYFLATKFSAFFDRGGNDPRTSHDFEDIVYLLNHTSDITEQVISSESRLKSFLKDAFLKIINDRMYQEAVIGNLFHEQQTERFNKIIAALIQICNSI
jgi:predicted nucleotidyltransferase